MFASAILLVLIAGPALADTKFGNNRAHVSIRMEDHGASRIFLPLQQSERQSVTDGVPYAYGHAHAIKGQKYSIVITNKTSGRVLTCVAVDGRSIMNGEQVSSQLHLSHTWSDNCYILPAHGQLPITGWRDSATSVRSFYFTSAAESLASWKWDDRSAVGTIAVAIFPEVSKVIAMGPSRDRSYKRDLGTGAGDREESHVREVRFEAEPLASDVFVLHYATSEALQAAGLWRDENETTSNGDFGRYSKKPKGYIDFND